MTALKSRLRRGRIETTRYKEVDCALGRSCVWPECTCPKRESTAQSDDATSPRKGKRVYRTPAGPHVRRRVRPAGWSPLSDWVVVRTKTSHENFASTQCLQQDMETWCPRYIAPGKGVPQPLFPGYLFVRPGDRWRQLRNTRGVIDIVMMGGNPDFVSKAAFKTLRAMSDREGIVTLLSQRKPEKGERVQIKVGAWQGFTGLYDGVTAEGRLKVLFSMFGKTVTLNFRRASSIEVVTA